MAAYWRQAESDLPDRRKCFRQTGSPAQTFNDFSAGNSETVFRRSGKLKATMLTAKSAVEGQTLPSAPAPTATGAEFHAMGKNVIEMISHDGKWHPVDGSKKTPWRVTPAA